MPARKGLLAPQNTFLDTIANRFDGTHSNFVLGNAKVANIYPIVYCSDGFCDLTGMSRAQIMQKSCACDFLYGPKTDFQHRQSITNALKVKQEFKLELILYKSSGTPFWCLLDIVPILDEKHEVVLFLCSHKDITKEKLHQHQQQLLAQLQVQKKLAVAAALTATGVATGTASDSGNQEQASEEIGGSNGAGESVAGSLPAPTAALNMGPGGDALRGCLQNKANNLIKADQNLEEADEADLEALANQKALLSMDEFDIQDNDLNTNDATGDFCDMNDNDSDDLHHDKTTTNQYSRRRSRAVLYQLSGHYGYGRRSVNMKSKLKLNNRMNIPEYKTTTIEKQRFILSHYGVGKTCWDWLILIVSFYVAIVVPYNATFKPIKELNNHPFGAEDQQPLRPNQTNECQIDLIDIFVEVVFVIDVILNFRTTFVNRKGEVVTRPKVICKHYIRGWFIVDACAALPFDLLCTLNIGNRSRLDLNLLKLIRLLRLARLLQKMDRYSQYSYIILTLLMLIFSLLAHWCACIWYVIASTEIERSPGRKINWLYQLSDKLNYSVVTEKDMVSSYVTALYFTTSSLTSVGFGNVSANTNAEKIFSIVIMLIGALMHAVVFGNVTALIRVMYARRSNYQTRLRDLKDFFRLHQLPKELKQRMSDYFQTTWSLNHGIETYEILKDFPEELRGDVSLHLHREVLSLPIFETAPQGFLKSLARHIESKFCCPTEYLIHRGDALNYLYLVCNGSMEVLQDNMVVAILGKGDLVGYDVNAGAGSNHQHFDSHHNLLSGSKSLLNANSASISHQHHHQRQHHHHHVGLLKSSSDLKALTYCDLKCIHISGLLEVMQFYPEFSDTFHREIIHDLSFNLREMHEEPEFADTDNETMEPQERKEKRKRKDLLGEQASSGQSSSDSDSNGSSLNSAPNGGRQTKRPAMLMPSSSMLRTRRGTNGAALFNRTINQADNEIGRYDHVEATPIERNQNELAEEDEEGAEEDEDRQSDSDDEDEEEDEDDEEEEEEAEDTDSTARNDEEDKGGGGGDNGPSAGSGQTNNRSSREEAGDKQNSTTSKPDGPESAVGLHFGSQSAATERQSGLRNRRSKYDNWQSCDELKITRFRRQADDRVRGREEFDTMIIAANAISSEQRVLTETILAPSSGRKVKLAGAELRPAIQRHNAARKPPLSFDLSRNTTALVDRRRRSAGCIAASRPLLIGSQMGGAASVVARKNLQVKNKNFNRPTLMRHQFNTSLASSNSNQSTSSLTHINERDRPSCQLGSGGNRIRASKGPARSEAGNADCRGTLANALIGNDRSSLADLEITKETRFDSLRGNNNQAEVGHQTKLNTKQTSLEHYKRVQVIDDQSGAGQMIDKEMLANLSKSVNDMKSELKSELNQFRSTMQHLMQMLAIDRDRNEDDEDSNQIIRPVRIGCPTSGGHLRASKATSFSEIRLNQLIKTPSTSSLPIVKSRRRYFNEGNYNQHKVLWRRNQFRSIMEQQYKENSSSFSQNESLSNADNCENNSCLNFEQAAMEHCKNESKLSSCSKNPMPTSIGKPESDSTNADWLQTGIGTNLRPVSQCSTSTIILDSGQVGQAVCSAANVVSDQDSGRSSSSLNSSGLYCKQAENASFKDQSEVKNEIETSVSKTGRLAKISLRNDDEDNSYTIAIE